MKVFISFVAILVLILSCVYHNEEELYPSSNTPCDTLNVTFSGKIVPLLTNNCFSCHSNTTATFFGNGIRLENYSDVKFMAAAISGAINRTGTYSPMPKNGSKLKACLITQFDFWVQKGSPDN